MTTVLHLSDPHFGAHDDTIAETLLQHARNARPDVTILTGDLTMNARRSEMQLATRFVNSLPEPRMVLAGNHDIPGLNHLWLRLSRPFGRFQDAITRELEPSLAMKGLDIFSLNTNRAVGFHLDWSEGRVNMAQRMRLEQHFAKLPSPSPVRVLAMHHPVICPPDHPRALVKPLEPLQRSMAAARVDLALGGHFHRSYCLVMDVGFGWSSVVSQVSTACSLRTQREPQGFHLLEVDSGAMTCVRYAWDGSDFRVRDRIRTRRTSSGWELDVGVGVVPEGKS